ncbi:transglutaminase family protein [Acuticoccus sp.]|uniref:transglutaminase family protein n=1 Tax=Acuticoccus sp. TaxID=1904378 RepID=UPI003B52CE3B
MLYDVAIRVTYDFDTAASATRNVVRLLPADVAGEQRLVAGHLEVSPPPDERIDRTDFFGNGAVEVAFRTPHRTLSFAALCRIDRPERGPRLDVSPPPSALALALRTMRSLGARSPHHFAGSSRRVVPSAAITEYARSVTSGALSAVEAVETVGAAVHRDWRYDPGATTVETPTLEAFDARHGVCQDFAHIMIAALRGLGIPAGYVSGCLRTNPPPGRPRLEGADAMHAWVTAWCGPGTGWVDYDPTNAVFASADHIVIARGRDYADVAPVRGVMRTSGSHTSRQEVDVVPVG